MPDVTPKLRYWWIASANPPYIHPSYGLVDCGYNHPATILDLNVQEVGVLLRLQPTAMPLYLRQAGSLACGPLPELRLNIADYLRKATSDLVSLPVWLHSKGRSCSGIVHAYRLPPEVAEAARRRCRQDGNRKGRTPAQDTSQVSEFKSEQKNVNHPHL